MTEREIAATIRQALAQIKEGKKLIATLVLGLKKELNQEDYRKLQRYVLDQCKE